MNTTVRQSGRVHEIHGPTGSHGGETDQAVEGGNELRQGGDGDAVGDRHADASANAHHGCHLGVDLGRVLHIRGGTHHAGCHTNNTNDVTHAGRALRGQAADRGDACQSRSNVAQVLDAGEAGEQTTQQ